MRSACGPPVWQESPDLRIARFARTRYGVFTRKQAMALGATPSMIKRRLAAGRWERIHQAVYRLAGTPRSWEQRILAACLACDGAASHRAAGFVWQVPGFAGRGLELTVPRGCWCDLSGVIVHQIPLPPADITRHRGVPVTTPLRTLVDLSGMAKRMDLAIAVDDALRRGLVSIDQLSRRVGGGRRKGIGTLRSVVDLRSGMNAVPQSFLETKVFEGIIDAGLPIPECQYPIRDGGKIIAIVDFAYPERTLAIEADGEAFHSGEHWAKDLTRRNALTALGWDVIHATWNGIPAAVTAVGRALSRG